MKIGAIKAMQVIDKFGSARENEEGKKIFEKLIALR